MRTQRRKRQKYRKSKRRRYKKSKFVKGGSSQWVNELMKKFKFKYDAHISANPSDSAFEIMNKNKNLLSITKLSLNYNDKAIDILERVPIDYINVLELLQNRNERALQLYQRHYNIEDPAHLSSNLFVLSSNPCNLAVDIVLRHPEDYYWDELSSNSNDRVVDLLLAYPDRINWPYFNLNSNDRAVSLLLSGPPSNIYMNNFMQNPNEQAVDFFTRGIDSLTSVPLMMLKNPNVRALNMLKPLLMENCTVFEWHMLQQNPATFDDDTDRLHGLFMSGNDTVEANRENIMYRIPPEISRYTIDNFL